MKGKREAAPLRETLRGLGGLGARNTPAVDCRTSNVAKTMAGVSQKDKPGGRRNTEANKVASRGGWIGSGEEMASLSPASANAPPSREAVTAVSGFGRDSGFPHDADAPSALRHAVAGVPH